MSSAALEANAGGAKAGVTPKPAARASSADWLAVAAGTIGSLMATLDISITNSALPTIQGAIGASGTEATWVSTAYLVSEIVMIPLTGWFTRLFGLRNFLLIMAVIFVIFSMVCGISTTLPVMIIGRVGQGFSGGAMIPTALTIVSTRLPPAQRPIGIALFGFTAIMGPVIGPLIGGWLTENVSWHYAFFINLPIGIGLVMLLFFAVESAPLRLHLLAEADWLGIIGLSLGLGCITVVMEEGQRDYWFASPLICWLTILSGIGLVMLLAGQRFARRPVIDLRILLEREFGSVFVMGLVIGAGLYGVLYIIPQFLAAVPDYNAYQSGLVVLISGLPTLAIMPFFPLLVQKLDLRIAIALGLFLFSLSCWIDVNMTADTVGSNFTVSQILRGFGQGFAMLFLNQAASSAVSEDKAEDASGLFNAARNLGGSMGLAAIATLQDQRSTFHVARLNESLDANGILLQQSLAQNGSSPEAMQAQLATLAQTVKLQATVMTFNDLFFVFAIALFVAIPLVLLLRPLPKGQGMSAMH